MRSDTLAPSPSLTSDQSPLCCRRGRSVAQQGRAIPRRHPAFSMLVGVLFVLGSITTAQAYQNSAGGLDPSFGNGGRVVTPFTGPANDFARDITACAQPDGRLIVAGGSANLVSSQNSDLALVRFNTDGTVDTTFGSMGGVVSDFGGTYHATSVLALPDGRILATVYSSQPEISVSRIVLARFNSDGSPDMSFGQAGSVTTALDVRSDQDGSLAVGPDGRIIVAGSVNVGPSLYRLAVTRYEPDGTVDSSFGVGGMASVTTNGDTHGSDVVVAPDGRIVVVGWSYRIAGYYRHFTLVARFEANGTLDAGFGSGGLTEFGAGDDDQAIGVALQPDGRILVGSTSYTFDGCRRFAMARCNFDGTLDSSFGSGGFALATINPCSQVSFAREIALQDDGRIVMAGTGPDGRSFVLARWNDNGTLDNTFGVGGVKNTTIAGPGVIAGNGAYGVALQDDGRILVAGGWTFGSTARDFTVMRHNSDGSLDGSFGNGGVATATLYGLLNAQAVDIAAPCGLDGRFVTVGTNSIGWAIACYNVDGSLDSGFGDDGLVTDAFDTGATASAVGVQPDSRIIVAGGARPGSATFGSLFALARYNTDGSLDSSFNSGDGGGRIKIVIGGALNPNSGASSVAVMPDGRIVAGGHAQAFGFARRFAVVRLTSSGTLDATFGVGGVALVDFPGSEDTFTEIAVLPDGRIVAAGGVSGSFAVARLNPDGSLDTTFSDDGRQTTTFPDFVGGSIAGMAVQPDGGIVAVGSVFSNTLQKYVLALARYNVDGSLDSAFGVDGRATSDLGASSVASDLALQPDGRIVICGRQFDVPLPSGGIGDHFLVARYTADGALDAEFGAGGFVTTVIEGFSSALAIALQCDGRILAAGLSNNGVNNNFAVARYIADANQEPVAVCGGDITVECTSAAGAFVTLDATGSYDPDPTDVLTYHWDVSEEGVILDDPNSATPSGTFPHGITMATLTVTDQRGGVSLCDLLVTVQDTTPPAVMVTTSVASLWPANHTMRSVQIVVVATDACAEPGEILPIIVTVSCDEPDNAAGNGDGNTTGDVNGSNGYAMPILVTGTLSYDPDQEAYIGTVQLRAERAGNGDGRSYTISVLAFDDENNVNSTSCCVVVPHDRRPGS